MSTRSAHVCRSTKETQITLDLLIDGSGRADIETPLPFVDHMLEAFARHGVFDLRVRATGDIEVDAHHTVEDLGLCLGEAFAQALGERRGLVRYGSATLPMDETLVTCAIDFCGRAALGWQAEAIRGKWIGSFDCDLAKEFFVAVADRARANLHLVVHHGDNAHHIVEAMFKAFARAADAATQVDPRIAQDIPSTKGTLSE